MKQQCEEDREVKKKNWQELVCYMHGLKWTGRTWLFRLKWTIVVFHIWCLDWLNWTIVPHIIKNKSYPPWKEWGQCENVKIKMFHIGTLKNLAWAYNELSHSFIANWFWYGASIFFRQDRTQPQSYPSQLTKWGRMEMLGRVLDFKFGRGNETLKPGT